MSVTDDFSGTTFRWCHQELVNTVFPIITGGAFYGRVSAGYAAAYCASHDWTPTQRSKLKVVNHITAVAPGVRHSGRGSATSFYAYFSNGSLQKWVNGTQTILGVIPASAAIGDTIELDVVGTTLTTIKNTVTGVSTTDAAISTGFAGIAWLSDVSGADDWVGTGELTSGMALDAVFQGGNGGSLSSLTYAHTCSGANRILVVGFVGDTSVDNVTGVTYDGAPLTFISKQAPGSGNRWAYLYALMNPNAGTHNIIISSGSVKYLLAASASYTGVKQVTAADAHQEFVSSAVFTYPTSLTPNADKCWVVLFNFCNGGAAKAGAGAVYRIAESNFNFSALFDSGGLISPAAAYSMTAIRSSTLVMTHLMASFAPFIPGITFPVDPGVYTLTGTAATLRYTRRVTATPGLYTLTGTAATLRAARRLACAPGLYTVTGTDAAFPRERRLTAAAGTYTLTGTDARLAVERVLHAGSGLYTLTGTDAELYARMPKGDLVETTFPIQTTVTMDGEL